ncbi:MAG: glycosyltransferase [Planctomycetota bacterium]|nr:glycosyltransferase [Planctomycetota bacterium]
MRILHISTRLILGGSQENTVLSCEGQARLGHEVHLAFGPIFGPEGSLLARVEAFNQRCQSNKEHTTTAEPCTPIGIHVVPNLCRELSPRKDLRAFRELKRLIEQLQPDIVHTHSSKAGVLGRAAAWSVLARNAHAHRAPRASEGTLCPAIIHTIHGPPFMPIEGNPLTRTKIRLKNHLYTLAERFAARRCHTITSVADAMTEQFLARNIGTPAQYITVRSGMETKPFLVPRPGEDRATVRNQLGLAESDFVIGTVARLAEHKGHDDILDALGNDLRDHPNWKLLWIGDGWWGDRLRARAASMGLTNQLITTGLVPNDRVPAMLRAMDILVHPSSREGLPRTVPQALLTGVTPIAYDADGTREMCRTNQTGILVPVGDRNTLRAAVVQLHDDPDLRLRLAATGRAECAREFTAERMVQHLEEVYANALHTIHPDH